jgi:hypothetical protein
MKTPSKIGMLILMLAGSIVVFGQKPDFTGSWIMDRSRTFSIPGDLNQTMVVTQTGDQIDFEQKITQPGNDRTVKDTYFLDGKERDFTPQLAPGAPPAKGKRTSRWLPGNRGVVIDEVTTSQTPNGPATTKTTRKWTLSNDGELTVDLYIDRPNASFEAKLIFKKEKG